MAWDVQVQAQFYRIYGGLLSNLTFFTNPACLAEVPVTSVQVADTPAAGEAFFFLITSVNALANEGTAGFGTFAERSVIQSCP